MPPVDSCGNSKRYWRSLADLADAPQYRAFLEAEFPQAADPGGMSRRRWLQLMGASLALAGVAGCRWEKQEILPLAKRPADRVPGQPQQFATAMDLAGSALGLLVTCVDGRPIKVEGNPEHPASLGATDVFAQASILELYDPDRSGDVVALTGQGPLVQTWNHFAAFARAHFDRLRASQGAGLRFLAEARSSPTLRRLRAELLAAFPQAKWYEYEPISDDNERAGSMLAFGKPYRMHLALDRARVIVCLDADPLGSHPNWVRYARDFAAGRDVSAGRMSRLYAVESCFSITGAAADHRLPMRSRDVASLAAKLGMVLSEGPEPNGERVPFGSDREKQSLLAMAKDVWANKGKALFVAGPRQPSQVHAAVHILNSAFGRDERGGATFMLTKDPDPDRPLNRDAVGTLAEEITGKKVDTLVIVGGNPAYNAPADLDLARLLLSVPTRIRLGEYFDETSRLCTWHLPEAHYLESWGDGVSYDGLESIVQPLIEPLRNGKSAIELLAMLLGERAAAYELVRQTHKAAGTETDADFETRWRQMLASGVSPKPAAGGPAAEAYQPPQPLRSGLDAVRSMLPTPGQGRWTPNDLEVVFLRDASVYDGRFANSGWLQEMPDPITRLTWDNAALVSPATAEALGVGDEAVVKLKCKGREVELPVYVVPGQAAGSVAVALGYGRTAAGQVGGNLERGVEPVGVDVYPLRTTGAMEFAGGASLQPTGRTYPLAGVQDHFAIDPVGFRERANRVGELVREVTLARFGDKKNPYSAEHVVEHAPLVSLWQEPRYKGHRWGLSVDLTKCIGCGACAAACQAENNVPVVGKDRVLVGREMHWLRVDRYFRGHPDDPRAVFQPVMCQQCEMAPCEQVCPVAATVHSDEGLNDMVYNRCVGTRYCANNCPYKVRRFNFFYYHFDLDDPRNEIRKMVYNPQVTVRSRGVMEKCTYCVQRIQAAKIADRNQRPGEAAETIGRIQSACQQACPTQAIVFGDLADASSQVADRQRSRLAYGMLAELNVKQRTKYLARVRNPNPELAYDERAGSDG